MKRSEMEVVIALEIAKQSVVNDMVDCGWINVGHILSAIEKAGMLPPPKELDTASGRILHYYVHDSVEERGKTEYELEDLWETEK